ncbi:acyltransferase [Vibrio scophthalmi]|uniref:acyltransferase n=1 Tax=Vibrio scophthalmi TaxID=45658 RepID=UPI002284107E|nr:acyltransferase [Vibrio scophthalmi]MCY9804047.1 acyltransferase [Vibrio scophthalmi]
MFENMFFDLSDLKACGKNVIIGKTVRIRYPELVEIGDNVIIDDFTYISTALKLDSNVHIASGCKIIGGPESTVVFGKYSTLAPNVVVAAGSDDYIGGIATPMIPTEFKGDVEVGNIIFGKHCIVGSNSTVLPGASFEDGACLGAQSLAKNTLSAWALYAGIPARKIKNREKKQILSLEKKYLEHTKNV